MANIFGLKQDIDNRAKGIGKYKGSPTASQKFVDFGPQTA